MDPSDATWQRSPRVQAFVSSHSVPAGSGVPAQAPVPSHASSVVQRLPSSQALPGASGWPMQRPEPSHASADVQASLSLHAEPEARLGCRHPLEFRPCG